MPIKPAVLYGLTTKDYQLEHLAEVLEAFNNASSHVNDFFFLRKSFFLLCCGGLRARVRTHAHIFKAWLLFLDEVAEHALEGHHQERPVHKVHATSKQNPSGSLENFWC